MRMLAPSIVQVAPESNSPAEACPPSVRADATALHSAFTSGAPAGATSGALASEPSVCGPDSANPLAGADAAGNGVGTALVGRSAEGKGSITAMGAATARSMVATGAVLILMEGPESQLPEEPNGEFAGAAGLGAGAGADRAGVATARVRAAPAVRIPLPLTPLSNSSMGSSRCA